MGIFTYFGLNAFFIAAAWTALGRTRVGRSRRQLWIALAHVLVLTAVFDSLIIAAGIVAYDTSKLSGIMIWLSPIEDFAYAVVAVIFVPMVWTVIGSKKGDQHVDEG